METITKGDVLEAVEQLAKSEKGLNAIRHLLAWLEGDGLSLDSNNQIAVFTLLAGAWNGFPGSAREFMREYL
jgi:hypothetical protein